MTPRLTYWWLVFVSAIALSSHRLPEPGGWLSWMNLALNVALVIGVYACLVIAVFRGNKP